MRVDPGVRPRRGAIDFVDRLIRFEYEHLSRFYNV